MAGDFCVWGCLHPEGDALRTDSGKTGQCLLHTGCQAHMITISSPFYTVCLSFGVEWKDKSLFFTACAALCMKRLLFLKCPKNKVK